MNVIGAGKSLLLAEPPLNKPHLWFVLTEPEGNPEGKLELHIGKKPLIRMLINVK